jgi:uncharacterized protein (DUF433 family)
VITSALRVSVDRRVLRIHLNDCADFIGFRYNDFMQGVITTNSKVMHGIPCFAGTRVPVKSLFDHIESGNTIDYFLEQFPSVTRDQVQAVLEQSKAKAEAAAVVVD